MRKALKSVMTKKLSMINIVTNVFPGWTVAGRMEAQKPQAAPTRLHSRQRSWSALKSWWLAPDLALLLKRSPCHQLQLSSGLAQLFSRSVSTLFPLSPATPATPATPIASIQKPATAVPASLRGRRRTSSSTGRPRDRNLSEASQHSQESSRSTRFLRC